MGRPREAQIVFEEMRVRGLKASRFESVLFVYGRLGLFGDMSRIVHQMEDEGLGIDSLFEHEKLAVYHDLKARRLEIIITQQYSKPQCCGVCRVLWKMLMSFGQPL